MRLSTLAFAVSLLHVLCGLASAFCPTGSSFSVAPPCVTPLRANVHDDWWEERRRSRILVGGPQQPSTPMSGPEALQLDQASLEQVLTEFVESDFAAVMFRFRNIDPMDHGRISGMFEFVQFDGNTITLRVKKDFDERNQALIDRLSKYLRARIPQIGQIHAIHRDGLDIY